MDKECLNFLKNKTNNSNVSINESTPVKNDKNFNSLLTCSYVTPITNRSYDIDSAYFSSLKNSRSSQCSPISSFRSRFNQSYSYLDTTQNETKVDILAELFNRSIIHVIESILNKLSNSDYMRLTRVSKSWHQIIHDNLNSNKKRKISIKKEKNSFKTNKENISISKTNSIIDSYLEIEVTQSKPIKRSNSQIDFTQVDSTHSFNSIQFLGERLCSQKSKKNLKRL